jgi:hypothetical protein
MSRSPIHFGELQSDLDGKAFNIVNVKAVGAVVQNTLYVDSSMTTEFGSRATGLPFRTLAAAIDAAEPGDTIVLRPGIYAYDGIQEITDLDGLTIYGPGATITSDLVADEESKLLIKSNYVTIEGIEFDGMVSGSPAVSALGCIQIYRANNVTIRNCFIFNQAGSGIQFDEGYHDSRAVGNQIFNCKTGINCAAATNADTNGLEIAGNVIKGNRYSGIVCTGPGVASGRFLTRLRITNNEVSENDSLGNAQPGILLQNAVRGALVSSNYVTRESDGIDIIKCQNVTVSDNILKAIVTTGFGFSGCQGIVMTGNLLDGRNINDNPATTSPILILGFYDVSDDAGPFVISNNALIHLKTASNAVSVANANDISIQGNRIEGTTVFTATNRPSLIGNHFKIPQTTQAVLIDAGARGSEGITIEGNWFEFAGASITRCITTIDASALGIDDVAIVGNHTPVGQAYGIGTYGHSGSNAATNVEQRANIPASVTGSAEDGWLNSVDDSVIDHVFVSQIFGNDTTGSREREGLPFKTIAAAITAASSGDLVLVKDGSFNERITAKNGVTVRFLETARLLCTSASGCIRFTADSVLFTVYHEHTPIVNSQANVVAIQMGSFVGTYLALHASVTNSGASGTTYCVSGFDGSLEVWGNLKSSNSLCIGNGAGSGTDTLTIVVHGGQDSLPTLSSGTSDTVVDAAILQLTVSNGRIQGGGGIKIYPATSQMIFKRCTIVATAAGFAAVNFGTPDAANPPIFRDCVLVSEGTATKSINVSGAQDIILYGQTVANIGADPPTNVTFVGGGTYAVDAAVVSDG